MPNFRNLITLVISVTQLAYSDNNWDDEAFAGGIIFYWSLEDAGLLRDSVGNIVAYMLSNIQFSYESTSCLAVDF